MFKLRIEEIFFIGFAVERVPRLAHKRSLTDFDLIMTQLNDHLVLHSYSWGVVGVINFFSPKKKRCI
jgi:hypothetical protein